MYPENLSFEGSVNRLILELDMVPIKGNIIINLKSDLNCFSNYYPFLNRDLGEYSLNAQYTNLNKKILQNILKKQQILIQNHLQIDLWGQLPKKQH